MSTNYYTLDGKHIGKRWAAGQWCWECRCQCDYIYRDKVTRAERRYPKGDTPGFALDFVHRNVLDRWACPQCGREMRKDAAEGYNPALRELGFDKSGPRVHHGIDGANGFHWYTGYGGIGATIDEILHNLHRRAAVRDEYGQRVTRPEFIAMIANDVIVQDCSAREFS
jgi:hypothetical protein